MINPHTALISAMRNRKQVEASEKAGCYCCLAVFDPKEIKEYTDQEQTVLCPKCNVDSVIGSVIGELDESVLKQIHDFWFRFV